MARKELLSGCRRLVEFFYRAKGRIGTGCFGGRIFAVYKKQGRNGESAQCLHGRDHQTPLMEIGFESTSQLKTILLRSEVKVFLFSVLLAGFYFIFERNVLTDVPKKDFLKKD